MHNVLAYEQLWCVVQLCGKINQIIVAHNIVLSFVTESIQPSLSDNLVTDTIDNGRQPATRRVTVFHM